jgi:hypothetical protein
MLCSSYLPLGVPTGRSSTSTPHRNQRPIPETPVEVAPVVDESPLSSMVAKVTSEVEKRILTT